MSKNSLKCPDCPDFRKLVFERIKFEKDEKVVCMKIPYFECVTCSNKEPLKKIEHFQEIAEKHFKKLSKKEPILVLFEYEERRFAKYENLQFKYSSEDNYLIPGLERSGDNDGYLTPVFFDKAVLLHYSIHPEYSVKLFSFSSGDIFHNGEPLFNSGFGINRNGKVFKWLGDLAEDFKDENMKPHLLRFRASNIESDHDIYSKFYLSQIPSIPSEAFQQPDNEIKIFSLKNNLDKKIKDKAGIEITKVNLSEWAQYYKYPIMNERGQIFNAYLSLRACSGI